MDAIGQNDQTNERISPAMFEEMIKVKLEPVNAQISTLTELMDRLNSGKVGQRLTTASNRESRFQSELPFDEQAGT